MAMRCDNCGKGIMIGHRVSHAKNRTRRIFKPNLHSARILRGAGYVTMKLCTKCLRLLKAGVTRTKNQKKEIKEVQGSQVEEQPQAAAATV